MKIGYYQFNPRFGEVDRNLSKIESALNEQTDLLVLPELCSSWYRFVSKKELEAFAEEVPSGVSTQVFLELAKKIDGTIVAGLPEKEKNVFLDRRTDFYEI